MKTLKFGIIGAGFWSQFQLAGWREVEGAECVAVYNRTLSKAETLAGRFGAASVYSDIDRMLDNEKLDFVDVITSVETHAEFVEKAVRRRLPVICQKPMAASLEEARAMTAMCSREKIPLYIHENWRWQTPLRKVKSLLEAGKIGKPFRARIEFCSSFPVFDNQPFLMELDRFILTDVGSHILDAARFLFGEARSLHCHTRKVHQDIQGEDVATVMMDMGEGTTVVCDMSYASLLERERFPETFVLIEGESGSIELAPDYWVRLTTEEGTLARRCPPPKYPWADPAYALVHSSIVDCNRDLLKGLQGKGPPETRAADNLKTVELVFKSYASAANSD